MRSLARSTVAAALLFSTWAFSAHVGTAEAAPEGQMVWAFHVTLAPRWLRFLLKEPWPAFMTFYGTTAAGAGWIVPKKYVESVGDEGFKKAPIGAGPYRFVSFTPGVELVLEAFDGYWRKAPSVKRL